MPNWCSNTLWVEGNPEKLQKFLSKVVTDSDNGTLYSLDPQNRRFTLEGMFPTPEELLGVSSPNVYRGEANDAEAIEKYNAEVKRLEETYGYPDWYTWRLANWGTKWDVCDSHIYENDEANFMVMFDSAWSPPLIWLERVVAKYPELKFRIAYSEPGNGYCGQAFTANRGELHFEEGELEYTDDNGKSVEYDSEAEKWKYTDNGEYITDEDFFPVDVNPYL